MKWGARHLVWRRPSFSGTARAALLLGVALTVGCASTGERASRMRPVHFHDPSQNRVATVYGSLAARLPAYDATPALDLFLYGPNDYGKTILRNPQGMAIHDSMLYVCDQGYPDVIAIDLATGKSLRRLDIDHRPRCPVDVTVDASGDLLVADTTLRKILIYTANGRLVQQTSPPDRAVTAFRPAALCRVDRTLYVCNLAGPSIERFDLEAGQWLAPWDPPHGRLVAPAGIDADVSGVLHVADAIGGRIERVNAQGQWLEPIGAPGRRAGELVRPKQVLVAGNLLLIADAGRKSLCIFQVSNGKFVTEIHEQPPEWRGLTLPAGLVSLEGKGADRSQAATGDTVTADLAANELPVVVSDALSADSLTLIGVKSSSAVGGTP